MEPCEEQRWHQLAFAGGVMGWWSMVRCVVRGVVWCVWGLWVQCCGGPVLLSVESSVLAGSEGCREDLQTQLGRCRFEFIVQFKVQASPYPVYGVTGAESGAAPHVYSSQVLSHEIYSPPCMLARCHPCTFLVFNCTPGPFQGWTQRFLDVLSWLSCLQPQTHVCETHVCG